MNITINLKLEKEKKFKKVECCVGETLLKVIRRYFSIKAACGGFSACSTCSVLVDDFKEEINEQELDTLEMLPIKYLNARLACQVVISEKMEMMKVTVLSWSIAN